ncbi:MAG TPA: DUF3516 domain-containing protein, partial [Polyangiaceae bacterium]|nr:DUF3516 domain-containing protein [Polyangiaceae bacterium]
NIPIRTVVLTRLCKFDGMRTRILSVRDFLQICGRAGRKGYDDRGAVVVQAPEHVIENKRLEERAANKPGKKLVRKKPPTKGYVHWDRAVFDRLVKGTPEPLVSRFQVSHAMLLNVLSREQGGCRAMKELLKRSHERDAVKHRHAKTAIQMFRSLVEAEVITLVDDPARPGIKRAQVHVDLQREFSLHHTLSLFVVESIRLLDRELETYPFDVLSLVEAILEDPHVILRKQLDRLKGEAVSRMKAEGMEYEERMVELEKLTYPKPNAQFIYVTFDEFSARHPWVGHENIRPKGVAAECYAECHDFRTFVSEYKLERSEGLVLRYLTDVYKALVQTVPERAVTREVDDMIDFFGSVVRGVDASLLDEWERMRDPSYVPRPIEEVEEQPELRRGITANETNFTVLVRNAAFRIVQLLARGDYDGAAQLLDGWTGERLREELAPYFEDHERIRTDPRARGTEHVRIDRSDDDRWRVEQFLVDPEEHNDWWLELTIDLQHSDSENRPILALARIGH